MNVIDLAHRICWKYKHSKDPHHSSTYTFNDTTIKQFADLIRADVMKEVMAIGEAEYKAYDELIASDDAGHEEATAMIHLMRKLEKLK